MNAWDQQVRPAGGNCRDPGPVRLKTGDGMINLFQATTQLQAKVQSLIDNGDIESAGHLYVSNVLLLQLGPGVTQGHDAVEGQRARR